MKAARVARAHPALFAHPAQASETDERWTSPEVFDALGVTFDLDPAAPPGGVPWIPATRHYSVADNGLTQPWHGLVWLNPPFSNPSPWVDRFIDHDNGVLLFPLNINATWLFRLLRAVPAVILLEHARFHHPTHTGRHVPVGVALTGLGAGHAVVVDAAPRLRGVLLTVTPPPYARPMSDAPADPAEPDEPDDDDSDS